MPINNTVNKDQKIIYTICTGIMKPEDFDLYINTIWTSSEYFGFNELFDTILKYWNTIDPRSKLAWVVLKGKQKELTDFYKAAKSVKNTPSRSLEAFYSKEEALDWLNKRE